MSEMLRLLGLFRTYWGWMILGMLVSLLTLIANVALMGVSGWFITAMAVAGAAGVSMNYFTPAAVIRACAIVRTGGRYGERLITHEATFRLLARLRVWFYAHLEPLAPARLQHYHSGDLLSRIRADVDTLDHFYLRVLVPVAVAVLGTALFSAVIAAYSPAVALSTVALTLTAGVAVPWLAEQQGRTPGRRIVETSAALRTAVIDGLQGLSELTVYGAGERQADTVNRLSRSLTREQDRMSRWSGITQGAVGLCASVAMWLCLVLATPLVRTETVSAPQLAMLVLLVLASFEAVVPLPLAFQMLGQTRAAARRLFEIVDAVPAVREPDTPSPSPECFGITLESVTFRYTPEGPDVLEDIDLTIPPGGRVAVLGPTGSGKSTLVNLLLRFWEPRSGRITLGGHHLTAFRGEDLRRHVAVVSQHTHLFNATIRENLLIACPDASPTVLEQAARTAQIHDFIMEQPEGYDTWVGEAGVRLSGGQARRVSIARALLRDAPVLVLDEPTEGLDAATERSLMRALVALMADRTVLLISHRLAGLESADEILVLHEGRIAERGTRSELTKHGRMFQGFLGFSRLDRPAPIT